MYLNALQSLTIPDTKTLSLIYMANKARCTFEGINTFRLIALFCFLHSSCYILVYTKTVDSVERALIGHSNSGFPLLFTSE